MWQSTATVALPSERTHCLHNGMIKGELLPDMIADDHPDGKYLDDYYYDDVPFLLETEPENYDSVFVHDDVDAAAVIPMGATTKKEATFTPTRTGPQDWPGNHSNKGTFQLACPAKCSVNNDSFKKPTNESPMVNSNIQHGPVSKQKTIVPDANHTVLQKNLEPSKSIKKHLCVPPERKPRRVCKKKSTSTKPSSPQDSNKKPTKSANPHNERKNNKSTLLKKKEKTVKPKLKSKPRFTEMDAEDYDCWQRSFLDFINLPSRTIREQTGQPLSRRQMRTWERQKIAKTSTTTTTTTSIGQHFHQNQHPHPVSTLPSGEDRVMIRMNEKSRTLILFDTNETTYQLGLWVQEQRQQYQKHRSEQREPPLSFQACGRPQGPVQTTTTTTMPPALNPSKDISKPKEDDAQTKVWKKESEACYEYLEQSYRYHLLDLVGLQLEMKAEDTIVEKKYYAPLPV